MREHFSHVGLSVALNSFGGRRIRAADTSVAWQHVGRHLELNGSATPTDGHVVNSVTPDIILLYTLYYIILLQDALHKNTID